MTLKHWISRLPAGIVAAGLAASATLLALVSGLQVDLIEKAAGIPSTAQGVGHFINGAQSLVTPALAMTAAVAPIALIAGAVVVLFGGRRGMHIIASALGVLLLLGSVNAILA